MRNQRQANVDRIATKIAQFKRDFIGAPIRKALLAVQANAAGFNCEIPYRKDEKYWIYSPGPGSCCFYFSLNYSTSVDVSLARICLLEFKDATRHVNNSISVNYFDKSTPPEFSSAFPQVARENYTNGIIQFSKSFTST